MRLSDEVWKELGRLRMPLFGMGKQKTWEELFNILLIEHHGNGDWRTKVKKVDLDPKLQKELYAVYERYLKDEISKMEYHVSCAEIESRYYNRFSSEQTRRDNGVC